MPLRYFCDNCGNEVTETAKVGARSGKVYLIGKNKGWNVHVDVEVKTLETAMSSSVPTILCSICIRKAVDALLAET